MNLTEQMEYAESLLAERKDPMNNKLQGFLLARLRSQESLSAPVISSFISNPTSINANGNVTLSWVVTGSPTTLTVDRGVGSVLGLTSKVVNAGASTGTFTLTATNANGTATRTVTVTVTAVVNAPVISSFTANPSAVSPGTPSTLSWAVTGDPTALAIDQGVGSVLGLTSKSVNPGSASKTYALTATNPAATVSKSVLVTVNSTTPLLRSLKNLEVDPNYSPTSAYFPSAAQPWLARIIDRVNEKNKTATPASSTNLYLEEIYEIMVSQPKEKVGRPVAYWEMSLRHVARFTGWDWHVQQSKRLLNIFHDHLRDTNGDGYKNMKWDRLTQNDANYTQSQTWDFNKKEENLGWTTIASLCHTVWSQRNNAQKDDALVNKTLLVLKDHFEAKWLDKFNIRVPTNDTYHPFLQAIRYFHLMYQMTGQAYYKTERDKHLENSAKDFVYYEKNGVEILLYGTKTRTMSGADKADFMNAHMAFYFPYVLQIMLEFAFEGFQPFANNRFLSAAANTYEWSMVRGGPFNPTFEDSSENMTGAYIYKDILGYYKRRVKYGDPRVSTTVDGMGFKEADHDPSFFMDTNQARFYPFGCYQPWASDWMVTEWERLYGKPDAWVANQPQHFHPAVGRFMREMWKSKTYPFPTPS